METRQTMFRRVVLLMLISVMMAANGPQGRSKDSEVLQGLWKAVDMEENGRRDPAEVAKGFQIKFEGDQIIFNPTTENRRHTFTVEATAKPKSLDLTIGDGPKKGRKFPCAIYKIEGSKLTLCLDKKGNGERPTSFKTDEGDGFALIVLERVDDRK